MSFQQTDTKRVLSQYPEGEVSIEGEDDVGHEVVVAVHTLQEGN